MTFNLYRSGPESKHRHRLRRLLWAVAVVSASVVCARADQPSDGSPQRQAGETTPRLIVGNLAGEARTISTKEFAALPRVSVRAKIPHTEQMAAYEGVLLGRVLQEAGIQPSTASQPEKREMPRPLRSAYVLVEAADGYQVLFSIAEVFPEVGGRNVVLADRMNGKPLDAKAGPYQVVVPDSAIYERWIRQVRRILVRPGIASLSPSKKAAGPEPTVKMGGRGGLYLVGLGPGDPDLITLKAVEILRKADRVFCAFWVKDEVARFTRPDQVEIAPWLLMGGQYCGRNPDDFQGELRERVVQTNQELRKFQSRIRELLAQGKTVVLADAGDPTIYSPWGWVPEQLQDANPVVVPGIGSFNAANAALKHGAVGEGSVTISSGVDIGVPDSSGRLKGTIALFTHTVKLPELISQLKSSYPADTPVAIVCEASHPTEKVIHATVGTLDKVTKEKMPRLYLLYVGDGLKLRANSR
jgi:precorrin-4/cobalt-precorrin-4 C11-methyltransferase